MNLDTSFLDSSSDEGEIRMQPPLGSPRKQRGESGAVIHPGGISTGTENDEWADAMDVSNTPHQFQQLSADPMQAVQSGRKKVVPMVALEEDFHKMPGQKFAVLSFIDSSKYKGLKIEGSTSRPMHLLKIRGIFNTVAKAESHVKTVRKMDAHFDFHIVECHKWTTVGAHMGSEQVWENDLVNSTMQEYFEQSNEAISDMQHRIDLKGDGSDRSDSTKQFFDESQKRETEQQEHDIFGGCDIIPMSLSELAANERQGQAVM